MRASSLFVAALVGVLVLTTPRTAVGQDGVIFREISIAPYGSIELGQPFAQAGSVARQLSENVYLLPPGFGGTLGIAVALGQDRRVTGLVFEYAPDYDFDAAVAGYREDLGEPSHQSSEEAPRTQPGQSTVCVVWEDSATRFEMYRRGTDQFLSMMMDRQVFEDAPRCLLPRIIEDGVRLLPRSGRTF